MPACLRRRHFAMMPRCHYAAMPLCRHAVLRAARTQRHVYARAARVIQPQRMPRTVIARVRKRPRRYEAA